MAIKPKQTTSRIETVAKRGIAAKSYLTKAVSPREKKTPSVSGKTATQKGNGGAGAASIREKIERKAYELFEQRGYNHGNDQGDWLEAERIVKNELAKNN